MGFDTEAPQLEANAQVEMCKMGIKNYIKLTKKCISDKDQEVQTVLNKSI